jgi:uncharacterized protein
MKCPNCGETLAMTTREGIEIDYCPACRGVWLDRGELDKIIERSAAVSAPAQAVVPPASAGRERYEAPRGYEGQRRERDDDDDDRRRGYGQSYGPFGGDRDDYDKHGRRKKRSFLGDLFDFD